MDMGGKKVLGSSISSSSQCIEGLSFSLGISTSTIKGSWCKSSSSTSSSLDKLSSSSESTSYTSSSL
ncbi:hypothetical protein RchiOBHm_Chr7g0238521 [Rosa chinensis]|uniref:Uncharacterized protein n=1 Tax=Rosa chinensis TaxID=74649 RepID=A0A2P6PHG2_ROSCH|nr:hypothetical protein RchiOBHm_Chr7g0238521 [Rosa chinensis]